MGERLSGATQPDTAVRVGTLSTLFGLGRRLMSSGQRSVGGLSRAAGVRSGGFVTLLLLGFTPGLLSCTLLRVGRDLG